MKACANQQPCFGVCTNSPPLLLAFLSAPVLSLLLISRLFSSLPALTPTTLTFQNSLRLLLSTPPIPDSYTPSHSRLPSFPSPLTHYSRLPLLSTPRNDIKIMSKFVVRLGGSASSLGRQWQGRQRRGRCLRGAMSLNFRHRSANLLVSNMMVEVMVLDESCY